MNDKRKILFYPKEPEFIPSDKVFCFWLWLNCRCFSKFYRWDSYYSNVFLSTNMFILEYRIFIINQDKKLEYEIPIDKFDRMEYEQYDLLNMYRMGELI